MINSKSINPVGKYFTIETYGCQMNEHDSEKLAGMLEALGYTWTDNKDKADLILYKDVYKRQSVPIGKIGRGAFGHIPKFKDRGIHLSLIHI